MRSILLGLLLALAAMPAFAQQEAPAEPRDTLARVRLTQTAVPPRRFEAWLLSADSQSLVVTHHARTLSIPTASIERLEVSRGRRTAGEAGARGAAHGFLLGVAVGGAYAVGILLSGCRDCIVSPGQAAGTALLLGGAAGAALGGLIGALYPGERWERVEPPSRMWREGF